MLYASGSLAIFVIGGLTGVMVAIAPFDWQAHDTYFVVAHLHYVLIGGTLLPLFGGLYYYWPLITGKKLSDRLGRIAFWIMFVGVNLTFFPMHLSGLEGMPRRVFTYPADLNIGWLNLASTAGSYLFATGVAVLVLVLDLALSPTRQGAAQPVERRHARMAGAPRRRGLGHPLGPADREPLSDLGPEELRAEGRRRPLLPARCRGGPARDDHHLRPRCAAVSVIRLGTPSVKPMITAVALGAVFILTTYHLYLAAAASGVVTLACVLWWLWDTAEIPEKPEKPIGHGMTMPLYISGPAAPGWWAMFITMMADATAFSGLVFGYYFYWTIHPDFGAGFAGPGASGPLLALGLSLASWAATVAARELNHRSAVTLARVALVAGAAVALASIVAALGSLDGLDPKANVYPAIVWVLIIWTAVHAGVGIVMQLYTLARSIAGA